MSKEEILESLEFYKRNVSMILGDKDSATRAIDQCIRLTKEVEETEYETACWKNVKVINNDILAKCSKCGLYVKYPYVTSFYLYDYCPNCGVSMRGDKTK